MSTQINMNSTSNLSYNLETIPPGIKTCKQKTLTIHPPSFPENTENQIVDKTHLTAIPLLKPSSISSLKKRNRKKWKKKDDKLLIKVLKEKGDDWKAIEKSLGIPSDLCRKRKNRLLEGGSLEIQKLER